MTEKVMTLM